MVLLLISSTQDLHVLIGSATRLDRSLLSSWAIPQILHSTAAQEKIDDMMNMLLNTPCSRTSHCDRKRSCSATAAEAH